MSLVYFDPGDDNRVVAVVQAADQVLARRYAVAKTDRADLTTGHRVTGIDSDGTLMSVGPAALSKRRDLRSLDGLLQAIAEASDFEGLRRLIKDG